MPEWSKHAEKLYGPDFIDYLKALDYPNDPVTKELEATDGYPGIEIIYSTWKFKREMEYLEASLRIQGRHLSL